jgi:CCR4-NOT transcription complex subunit 7/8
MREVYFDSHINDGEFNQKLFGFGMTFSTTNGIAELSGGRGGVTLAERDRGAPSRETPVPPTQQANHTLPSLNAASLAYPTLQGAYGPMSGAYLRQPIGVGGDR